MRDTQAAAVVSRSQTIAQNFNAEDRLRHPAKGIVTKLSCHICRFSIRPQRFVQVMSELLRFPAGTGLTMPAIQIAGMQQQTKISCTAEGVPVAVGSGDGIEDGLNSSWRPSESAG